MPAADSRVRSRKTPPPGMKISAWVGRSAPPDSTRLISGSRLAQRDLAGPLGLLQRVRVDRAAADRRVVGDDHALDALDHADAGDHAGADREVACPTRPARRQLQERRVLVDQQLDPLAGEQLAAGVVAGRRTCRRRRPRRCRARPRTRRGAPASPRDFQVGRVARVDRGLHAVTRSRVLGHCHLRNERLGASTRMRRLSRLTSRSSRAAAPPARRRAGSAAIRRAPWPAGRTGSSGDALAEQAADDEVDRAQVRQLVAARRSAARVSGSSSLQPLDGQSSRAATRYAASVRAQTPRLASPPLSPERAPTSVPERRLRGRRPRRVGVGLAGRRHRWRRRRRSAEPAGGIGDALCRRAARPCASTASCGTESAVNTPYGVASPGGVVSVQPGYEASASSTAACRERPPGPLRVRVLQVYVQQRAAPPRCRPRRGGRCGPA